jgi:hypothetical protein
MDNLFQSAIEDTLTLAYRGQPVLSGRMNSYDAAGYIIAFSDFVGVISRQAYGEKITLQTEIQGFRGNSFDIDFALRIAGITATLFLSNSPLSIKDFIDLIKESVKVWLHLNGAPPKSLSESPNKQNMFQIENQNGQITYVTADVLNIITDSKVGNAVEQFIKKPLQSGLSSVSISSKTEEEVVEIEEHHASCFIPIDIEKPLLENVITMGLLIEAPTFKEGNKWRFFDGQSSFHAEIEDQEFLKKVDSGEARFGKGDRLTAKVRFKQMSGLGSLRMERTIVQVLKHEISSQTDSLF